MFVPLRLFGDDPVLQPSETPANLRLWHAGERNEQTAIAFRIRLPAPEPITPVVPEPSQDASAYVAGDSVSAGHVRAERAAHQVASRTSKDIVQEDEAPEVILEERVHADTGSIAIDDERYVWLAVSCMHGAEDRIRAQLQDFVNRRGLHDQVPTIISPVVEIVAQRQDRRKAKVESLGFILIQVAPDFDALSLARGTSAHVIPTPIPPDEVMRLLKYKHTDPREAKLGEIFTIGCRVRIVYGSFAGYYGTVTQMGTGKRQITVAMEGSRSTGAVTMPIDWIELVS